MKRYFLVITYPDQVIIEEQSADVKEYAEQYWEQLNKFQRKEITLQAYSVDYTPEQWEAYDRGGDTLAFLDLYPLQILGGAPEVKMLANCYNGWELAERERYLGFQEPEKTHCTLYKVNANGEEWQRARGSIGYILDVLNLDISEMKNIRELINDSAENINKEIVDIINNLAAEAAALDHLLNDNAEASCYYIQINE